MLTWLEPLIKRIGLVREPQVTSKKIGISPSTLSEKAMETHSSTLAWKIPWLEEPGRLQSKRSQSRAQLSNFTFTFHFHALEKEMATHCSILAWRIPGTEEPGELQPIRLLRVRHDWSGLAQSSGRTNYSSVKKCSLILQFIKMISVECFKARHIWYKDSTCIFLVGRDYFWMGMKNRNKKRLSGKHCPSYGHSIAAISYGPSTPLLAYGYGKWIDWECQLIFEWFFLCLFLKWGKFLPLCRGI